MPVGSTVQVLKPIDNIQALPDLRKWVEITAEQSRSPHRVPIMSLYHTLNIIQEVYGSMLDYGTVTAAGLQSDKYQGVPYPSRGVRPIEVSIVFPPLIAVTDAPAPTQTSSIIILSLLQQFKSH